MTPEIYSINSQPLKPELYGCSLEEWQNNPKNAYFALHPKKFPIFLPHDEIISRDEYLEGDPYHVAENVDGLFNRNRIDSTLELIKEALGVIERVPGKSLKILDLGCGEGHITNRIDSHFSSENVSLFGLDLSLSAIEVGADLFPNLEFAVGDVYKVPFAPGFFDIAICNNLWEHVPDPLRLLERITHLLKSTGVFILSTPSRYRLGNLIKVILGKQVDFISSHHITEYTVGQVVEQLRFGGYETKRIIGKHVPSSNWKFRGAHFLFSAWCSLVRSSHSLEPTIFVMARKTGDRLGVNG